MMSAPLAGIKVVEIANFVAVPACGALLADLGAEVIKVEVPWGEIYRHATPRLAGYDSDFPIGAPFNMDNRGKRSLTLDLVLPQAQEALVRVVETADVVITNVLPARLAKYGLAPEALMAKRPELIFARLSGYGSIGERANDPAFDYTAFWALSGLMDSIRDPEAPPAFMRPGVGDHSAALSLAVGILAALRTRDAEGHGQLIEVTLQQVGYYINGNDAATTLVTGQSPPVHDRREPRNPLWNHYACQGGRWISLVMINGDAYWPGFTRAIGRPELEKDPRFDGAVQRFRNSRELVEILDGLFVTDTVENWGKALSSQRLIWAPVRTLAEAASDESAIQNGAFATAEHPEYGEFRTVAPPLTMSAHPMPASKPAPALGVDTGEVLTEAGVDAETIALLTAVTE
jgi:crotonobetainyl-CoA:carnitine CoA-transferase CaiB-like acyl-CoA transferase